MENGFSTPKADKFPAGLRVLVVDDDPTWIKILEKMLRKCLYEVTTCCLARDALKMLRERKDGFDIVISDVNMPDMDGFKLLEHVGLEMDLPVIMMSVDGEISRVMKGIQHGACDYLLKPIRMKELSNIWQHVFRKKIHEVKDTESYECTGHSQLIRNESDDFHDGHLLNEGSLGIVKKRKDVEDRKDDEQELVDSLASKKARVVWSVELHQKFVDAVNQIGFDKVGPKKILDLMNVSWLTRENVASHLQKFRQYLSRLQKENEQKTSFGGIKQQDFSSGDLPGGFGFQNSIAMDLKNAANSNFEYATNKIPIDGMGSKVHDSLNGMVSFLPVTKSRSPLTGDFLDHCKASLGSQMNQTYSFQSLDQNFKHQPLESTLPTQEWNEVSMMQFKQPPNQELEPYPLLEDNYSPVPLSGPGHHFQVDLQNSAPPTDLRTSFLVCNNSSPVKIKPRCTQYRSNGDRIEFPVDCGRREKEEVEGGAAGSSSKLMVMTGQIGSLNNSNPLATGEDVKNQEAFKAIPNIMSGMNDLMVDQTIINNTESVQQKLIAVEQALATSLEENSQSCLLQEYGCMENIGYQNVEHSDYYNSELIADLQAQYYDDLGFNNDTLCNSIENPFVDQGLFIACSQAARVNFCD